MPRRSWWTRRSRSSGPIRRSSSWTSAHPRRASPASRQLLIPRPLASDGRDVDLLDPLRAFVAENYDELTTADGWVIYELRGS